MSIDTKDLEYKEGYRGGYHEGFASGLKEGARRERRRVQRMLDRLWMDQDKISVLLLKAKITALGRAKRKSGND